MSTATLPTRPVLGDLLPGTRVRDAALVLTGALFLAVAAQLAIPLWFTPVPLSLATFAVLLNGAALGPTRGGLSVLLYAAMGIVGIPVFADHATGWAFASFGYVLGYIPAALAVGVLARRRVDRSLLGTIGLGCLGAIIVYAVGVPWLMGFAHVDLMTGLRLGAFPFLAGDALKAVVIALLLPGAWKVIDKVGARKS